MKKMWYIHTTDYYSAIQEQNWVTCRNVDGPRVIQSKVSQKEKNMYHIITCICGIWKNDLDDLIYKVEIETQT